MIISYKRHNKIVKILSLIVACAFLMNTIAWASGDIASVYPKNRNLQVQTFISQISLNGGPAYEQQLAVEAITILSLLRDKEIPVQDVDSEVDKWLSESPFKSNKRILTLIDVTQEEGSSIAILEVMQGPDKGKRYTLSLNIGSLENMSPGEFINEVKTIKEIKPAKSEKQEKIVNPEKNKTNKKSPKGTLNQKGFLNTRTLLLVLVICLIVPMFALLCGCGGGSGGASNPVAVSAPVIQEEYNYDLILTDTPHLYRVEGTFGDSRYEYEVGIGYPVSFMQPSYVYKRDDALIAIHDNHGEDNPHMSFTSEEMQLIVQTLDRLPLHTIKPTFKIMSTSVAGWGTVLGAATQNGTVLLMINMAENGQRIITSPDFPASERNGERSADKIAATDIPELLSHEVGHLFHYYLKENNIELANRFEVLHNNSGSDTLNYMDTLLFGYVPYTSATPYGMTNLNEDFATIFAGFTQQTNKFFEIAISRAIDGSPVLLEKLLFMTQFFLTEDGENLMTYDGYARWGYGGTLGNYLSEKLRPIEINGDKILTGKYLFQLNSSGASTELVGVSHDQRFLYKNAEGLTTETLADSQGNVFIKYTQDENFHSDLPIIVIEDHWLMDGKYYLRARGKFLIQDQQNQINIQIDTEDKWQDIEIAYPDGIVSGYVKIQVVLSAGGTVDIHGGRYVHNGGSLNLSPEAGKDITGKIENKQFVHNGVEYGCYNEENKKIEIDIEEAKRSLKLEELSDHKITGFVHAHEIFHHMVDMEGVIVPKDEEEALSNLFAKRTLGLLLNSTEAGLLNNFVKNVKDENIRHQLSLKYEDADFLLNLHRMGVDILNIENKKDIKEETVKPENKILDSHNTSLKSFSLLKRYFNNILSGSESEEDHSPVDIVIDMNLIPKRDIKANIETWAYLILMCRDLENVNFIFENSYSAFGMTKKEDSLNETETIIMLKNIIREKSAFFNLDIGIDEFIEKHINSERRDEAVEIVITSKDLLRKAREEDIKLEQNQYPVALDDGVRKGDNIALRNFEAALTIGLAKAALVLAKRRDENTNSKNKKELPKLRKELCNRLQSLYSVFRKDVKLTENTLDNMIYPDSAVRMNLAIRLSLPPIVRLPLKQIQKFHESIQLLLQSV